MPCLQKPFSGSLTAAPQATLSPLSLLSALSSCPSDTEQNATAPVPTSLGADGLLIILVLLRLSPLSRNVSDDAIDDAIGDVIDDVVGDDDVISVGTDNMDGRLFTARTASGLPFAFRCWFCAEGDLPLASAPLPSGSCAIKSKKDVAW